MLVPDDYVPDLPDLAEGVCPNCGGAGDRELPTRKDEPRDIETCEDCEGTGLLGRQVLTVRTMVVLDVEIHAEHASEREVRLMLSESVERFQRIVGARLRCGHERLGFLPDGEREVDVCDEIEVDRVEILEVSAYREDMAA